MATHGSSNLPPFQHREHIVPFVVKKNASIKIPNLHILRYEDQLEAWNNYLIEILQSTCRTPIPFFGTPKRQPKQNQALQATLSSIRSNLISAINDLDRDANIFFGDNNTTLRECPHACIKLPPPPPKVSVDKSIATDPPAPLPNPHDTDSCAGTQTTSPNLRELGSYPKRRSYAKVAASPLKHSNLPPKPAPTKSGLTTPAIAKPVRLVVQFAGNTPQHLRDLEHTHLFQKLSSASQNTSLLAVHWNKSENLIISLAHGTSDLAALALRPTIRAALEISDSVDISIDKPWSRLLVSSVPARGSLGKPVFSESDLARSLLLNPTIQNIPITRQPRWIRNPTNITGAKSSFSFSFEDPDGSIAQLLCKTPLFVFGAPVTMKRWKHNPKARKSPPGPSDDVMDVAA
ncbi:hypothetical protein FRC12_012343 [Ceratobasidium sp. 428]|nr:hypothetical protein FRC12_012343 [Ceratobasidium sp. 428]